MNSNIVIPCTVLPENLFRLHVPSRCNVLHHIDGFGALLCSAVKIRFQDFRLKNTKRANATAADGREVAAKEPSERT